MFVFQSIYMRIKGANITFVSQILCLKHPAYNDGNCALSAYGQCTVFVFPGRSVQLFMFTLQGVWPGPLHNVTVDNLLSDDPKMSWDRAFSSWFHQYKLSL